MKRERMYMFMTVLVFAGAILWLGSRVTPAQSKTEPAPSRVATVDVSKVFIDYDRSKQANEDLQKRQETVEKTLKGKGDQINALKAELDNFTPDSKESFERQEKLLNMQVEFDVYRKVRVEEVGREMQRMTEEIYTEIVKAVESVAAEQGYDLVLYGEPLDLKAKNLDDLRDRIMRRKVLYSSPRVDLTQLVLQKLNQDYRLKKAAK